MKTHSDFQSNQYGGLDRWLLKILDLVTGTVLILNGGLTVEGCDRWVDQTQPASS